MHGGVGAIQSHAHLRQQFASLEIFRRQLHRLRELRFRLVEISLGEQRRAKQEARQAEIGRRVHDPLQLRARCGVVLARHCDAGRENSCDHGFRSNAAERGARFCGGIDPATQ